MVNTQFSKINLEQIRQDADTAQLSFSQKNILSISVNETGDVTTVYKLITNPCPKARAKFVQVQNITRTLYEGNLSETDKSKLKTQLDYLKKDLGFYFPSGTNEKGHLSENLSFNGCIGFDYDFRFKGGDFVAKALKKALKPFDFVSLVHLSSGGYGLKGIIQTDLKECDTDLYKFAEKQIFSFLASKGISFSYDPHGYGKTCYFAYDKDAYLNLNTKSFHIDLDVYEQEKAVKRTQNECKTSDYITQTSVEHAAKFLIDKQINVTESRDEYLSIVFSCLHAFGIEKGEDYARELCQMSAKFNESNFKSTVKSWNPNHEKPITGARILKAAAQNGFKFQPIHDPNFKRIKAKQGEFLSDVLHQDGAMFTGEYFNNTQTIAPTGTGKSVTISKIRGKKVVVCPTNGLCNNFKKHGAIVHTGVNYSERDEILNADFIATTHANLPNLSTIIDPKIYHLAIDEAHNFTTSASKKFMLKDLKRTLRLSHNFANRSLWTGTDIYNFHSDIATMKKVIVDIPKPKKQAFIIDAKSVIQSTIDRAKASIEGGRFPIILLNNKMELLAQLTEGVKNLGFQVLNSDEKETAFFKELTETGNISCGAKGIITTSVIKEGNDIYNELDFDFIVCNMRESIFHSIEIEQLVNRARKPKSVNVFIIKSKNRKKIDDTFDPIEVMKTLRTHTENRVNELNNCPSKWLIYEKNAQFGSDYAFVENEKTGKFELCELLLSFKVFEAERRFEMANEAYQRTQLTKFGFTFNDTITDNTDETDEIKAIFKTEREARKTQKTIDFEATKNDIITQIENNNEVILPNIDTAPNGKKFAVSCFEKLTEIGVQPEKVFELIDKKGVKNDPDLGRLVKSVSFFQLANNTDYMKENSLTAIRLQLISDSIKVGNKYTTSQLRGVMRRVLNLQKGFNTRRFDKDTTSQQVLDFTRLFFDISANTKTKIWVIKGSQNYSEFIIENESKLRYPNSLKINDLQKKTFVSDAVF